MWIIYKQEEMTKQKNYAWLGINNHDFIYYVQTK